MGSSHHGILTGRKRHGFGQYFMGTSLTYMTASAIFRATRTPYVVGGAAMLWGYLDGMLTGKQRFEDPAFRRFLRDYQRNCLLLGKARATARVDAEQEQVWKASHGQPGSP
jgi:hypothetical protein